MEILGALEGKIKGLIVLVKDLRAQKENLETENVALLEKVNQLEQTLSKQSENNEWDQEKASARKAVNDLISDIDSLIDSGSR